ncbi:MAG: hypothetical protein V4722_17765 [Bacteroidota bacterium]
MPFFCFGQTEIYPPLPISPGIIQNTRIALLKAGKLDSLKAPITFFKDAFTRRDSVKQFYVYADTVKYTDNFFAIGKIILDPSMEFERRKIGEWTFYYPSGEVYSKGSYSIGAYTDCEYSGYALRGYSYKTAAWKYWYDIGILMAEGIYEPAQHSIKTWCEGGDTVSVSRVTLKWNLFDNTGNKMSNDETIAFKINSSH